MSPCPPPIERELEPEGVRSDCDTEVLLARYARCGGFSGADLEHEIVPGDVKYARKMGAVLGVDYHEWRACYPKTSCGGRRRGSALPCGLG